MRLQSLESRLMLSADWRNPVNSVDVTRDGLVTPLDALVVLNEIGRRNRAGIIELEPRPMDSSRPFFDVDGDGQIIPLDALRVINSIRPLTNGEYVLKESIAAASELSVLVGLGLAAGSRTYQFDVDSLFDQESGSSIQDALAVYLVDPAVPQTTLLDRGTPGTAFFVLSGGRADFVPGKVRFDGQTVSVDLSEIDDRTTGRMVFQLISQNRRSDTAITIRPRSNEVDPAGLVPARFSQQDRVSVPVSSINLAGLTSAARDQFDVDFRNVRFDRTTGRYEAEMRLTNRGPGVGRDLAIVFPGLPVGAVLENAAGTTASGHPLLSLRSVIPTGGLGTGQQTDSVRVVITTPTLQRFHLSTEVLVGQPNRAPVFTPLAPITVVPGQRVDIPLGATDPDVDRVTYSMLGNDGPTMRLDSSGTLSVMPTPAQIGNHRITLIASDGVLASQQELTINVVADPITRTRVSGQVLDVDGTPLQGLQVEVGAVQGLTLADGRFTLDLGNGPIASDTLRVRGETFSGAASYPFIAEKLPFMLGREIYQGFNNVIHRPIYLPKLNSGVPVNPTVNTTVTATLRPDTAPVEVAIAAGSLLTQQGAPFTGNLSITEVPVNLTPAALPPNLIPDQLITIQPGEMAFATPAPLTFPNTAGWPPGTVMDLWSINPTTGEFEIVGEMLVSGDGQRIETVSGGIRNSSWHFPAPPPPTPRNPNQDPKTPDNDCNKCEGQGAFTSNVLLHSGAVVETHDLVTYQSLGETRGLRLAYDSLRADPRPILHFGYDNVIADDLARLYARLTVQHNDSRHQVPGYQGPRGLPGEHDVLFAPENAHFWNLANGGNIDAALQADLRALPSGQFEYQLEIGLGRLSPSERGCVEFANGVSCGLPTWDFSGSSDTTIGHLTSVNMIASPFGAGWSIAGWQELVENRNGSVLLIDGGGSQLLFKKDATSAHFVSPPGDFSRLEKLANGTYRRTSPGGTVYQFNAAHRLQSVTDRIGNQTTFRYDSQGRLVGKTDPVGLETNFTYVGSRIASIIDPAGRVTRLEHDAAGNLTRITDPDGSSRHWVYDSDHHIIQETDQRGLREETQYDFAGRATRAVRKDGSVVNVAPVQTQGLLPPSLTINPLSAPIAPSATPAEAVYTDGNGNTTRYLLDKAMQVISSTDAAGAAGTVERTSRNQVAIVTDALGNRTEYAYDGRGNLISVQDSLSRRASTFRGSIDTPGAINQYRFSLQQSTQLHFDSLKVNGNLHWRLEGPSGIILDRHSFDWWHFQPSIRAVAGQYVLTISGSGDATGDYEFRMLDIAAATPLNPGVPVIAVLDPPASAVMYQFDASAGDQYFFDRQSEGPQWTRWSLVDPFGNVVFDRWFSDVETQTLSRTGTYTLLVDGLESGDEPYSVGFAIIPVGSVPVVPWEGTSVTLGANVEGRLVGVDDQQHYLFTLDADQLLFFDSLTNDGGSFRWTLEGPTGFLANQRAMNDELRQSLLSAVAGDYRLKINGTGDTTGDFQFRLLNADPAPSIVPGTLISGTLDPANSAAMFRFTANAGDRFFFDQQSPQGIFAGWTLFDPFGNQVFDSWFGDIDTQTLPRTGTYTLVVHGHGDARESASFAFNLQPVQVAPPTTLLLGSTTSGTVATPGDERHYRFELAEDQLLYFDSLTDSWSLQWTLEGPAGVLANRRAMNDEPRHALLAAVAGEYRLTITGAGDTTGDFLFRLLSVTAAPSIVPGSIISGTLDPANSVAMYRFTGNAGDRFFFDEHSPESISAAWSLFDPFGNRVFDHWFADVQTLALPRTGTYSLLIHGQGSAEESATFEFNIQPVVETAPVALVLGSTVSGSLATAGAERQYSFELAEDQLLYFDALTENWRFLWTLEGPAGVLVNRRWLSDEPSSNLLAAVAGDYRLTITGAGDTIGEYQFSLLSAAAAPSIVPGTAVSGTLDPANSAAMYRFTANAGDRFYFDEQAPNWISADWSLFDPFGIPVFARWFGDVETQTLARTGTYTLLINGQGSAEESAEFAFNVQPVVETAPVALVIGATVSGSLATPGAERHYRFDLASDQMLYFDTLTDSWSLQWTLEGPAGVLANRRALNDEPHHNLIQAVAGQYRLTITGAGDTTGDYQFRLLSTASAPSIVPDTVIGGTLDPANSTVMYRFTANAGDRFFFDEQSPEWVSAGWSLFDPYGNLVFAGWFSDVETQTLARTGTYTLVINGHGSVDGSAEFEFNVQADGNTPPETWSGTPLVFGQIETGTIATPGTKQDYLFTLNEASRLYFDALTDSWDMHWTLEGPAGKLVDRLTFNSGLANPALAAVDGQYRLTIEGWGDATGAFQFRLLDLADAELINPGTPVNGTLTPANSTKAYRFAATKGDQFFFDRLSESISANWQLIDPYGKAVFYHWMSDVETLTISATGEYVLLIEGYDINVESAAYEFNVQPVLTTSPMSLPFGTTIAGAIVTPGAKQRYAFTLDTSRQLHFDSLTDAWDPLWTLEGPAGMLVERQSLNWSPAVLPAIAGQYHLTIEGSGDATGDFQFRLLDLSTAMAFTPGTPVNGTLAPADSTAIYRFSANAEDRFFFDNLTPDWINASWTLVDPLGNQVFHRWLNDVETQTLARTGTYTLLIAGDRAAEGTGAFAFNVQPVLTTAPVAITVGSTVSGEITTAGQEQQYTFTLDSNRRLYFDSLTETSNLYWTLEGPAGTLVDYRTFNSASTVLPAVAGQYRLTIVGSGDLTGDFQFRMLDLAAATVIPTDTPVTDTLDPRNAAAIYRFDATAGDRFFFDAQMPRWFDASWRLVDPHGNLVFDTWFVDIETTTMPRSGTYTLLVDGNRSDGEAVEIRFAVVPVATPTTRDMTLVRTVGTRITHDPVFNQRTSITDELGRQTFFTIDSANGNVLSSTVVVGLLDSPENGETDDVVTTFSYTAMGQLERRIDALGRITRYQYDALGRMTSITEALGTIDEGTQRFEYNPAGNVTAVIDENGNRTELYYDAMNRIVETVGADPDGTGPLAAAVTRFTYDARGNLISTTDALGRQTQQVFDLLDRVVQVVDASNQVTRFQYDRAGNRIAVTDPLGLTTHNRYDTRNRLVESVDPEGHRKRFTYDDNDNLVSLTDPVGNVTRFIYDSRRRLVEEIDPLGNSIHYTFDASGQVIEKTDRNDRVTRYAYDNLRRLIRETWVSDGNVIEYVYDAVGNLKSAVDHSSAVALSYDDRNRIKSVHNAGTPGAPHVVLSYTYDAAGNVLSTSENIGGVIGATTNYAYDALDRNIAIEQTGPNVSPKSVDLFYNQLGQFSRIERFSDLNRSSLVTRSQYSYDELHRLIALEHGSANAARDLAFYDFQYDPASRITALTDIDGRTTFTYDRTSQLTGADRGTTDERGDELYRYDANGNRTSSHLPGTNYTYGPGNRLISDGTYQYAYDGEGNLIRRTDIASENYRVFDYDQRNRLVRVTDFSAIGLAQHQVDLTYDASDRRIAKTIDPDGAGVGTATTEHYVYDGEHVLLEFIDADGPGTLSLPVPVVRNLFGPSIDMILAQQQIATGETRWLLTDHLGTVRDLVSDSGQLLNHLQYDTFGNLLSQSAPGIATRYGFTGRELDASLGIYYYRARYYSPELGRFLQQDPIAFAGQDENLYRYVFNQPMTHTDPSGKIVPIIVGIWAVAEIGLAIYDTYDTASTIMDPCASAGDKLLAGGLWVAGAMLPGGGYSQVDNIAKGGAASAKQAADLAKHLRYTENYGKAGVKHLENGRVRYYGEVQQAGKPGEMAGRRYVHEYNPSTGNSRGWHETVDHSGNVRQVRPELNNGNKTHYMFDRSGNYTGSW